VTVGSIAAVAIGAFSPLVLVFLGGSIMTSGPDKLEPIFELIMDLCYISLNLMVC